MESMSKSSTPRLAPDPEVQPKPKRRRFSAAYKRRIVEECDAATESGAIAEILRREGLYSSHLHDWRRLRRLDGVAGLEPKKRGPKPKSELAKENERLRRELARSDERARRAELIIEAQKKLCEVLGLPTATPPNSEMKP